MRRTTNYTGWTVERWLRHLGDYVAWLIDRDPSGASIGFLGWAVVAALIIFVNIWVGG